MSQTAPHSNQEKKAQVQAYFSRTASGYLSSAALRSGSDLKRLVEVGEWQAHHAALDIATGGGHTALVVAPHVARMTVTDLTPVMLETARAFLIAQGVTNAEFQLADAEALPFAEASFDRVTCRVAPHHFPDVGQAVQEVARVLTPGGLFLLIDNIVPGAAVLDTFGNTVEQWRDPSHVRAYTQEEWHSFFAQAGLLIELAEPFRKTHTYDEWTALAQLPAAEKAALEAYILSSDEAIRRAFAVQVRDDGHLKEFTRETLFLKGRKKRAEYP